VSENHGRRHSLEPGFRQHAGAWRLVRSPLRQPTPTSFGPAREAWAIRDSDVIGDGVYKSVDAGRT
jgi:hypothetical protein